MRKRIISSLTSISIIISATGLSVYATEIQVQADVGAYASRGSYGNSRMTTIIYLPISMRVQLDRAFFKVSSGVVEINGPGNIDTQIDARANGSDRGLADSIFTIGYNTYVRNWLPIDWITWEGKVKAPTADASRGLGTGRVDYVSSVQVMRSLGKWGLLSSLIYRWRTSPSNMILRNTFGTTLGGFYSNDRDLSIGVNFEAHESSTDTGAPRRELMPYISWRWNKVIFTGYGQAGFAAGSPDFALGSQLGYKF